MDTLELLLLAAGAWYFINNSKPGISYTDAQGNPITQTKVGQTIGFTVSGRQKVWLYQLQNGKQQFNGPFVVPMQPYTLGLGDAGTFQAAVYELTAAGTPGALIGQASLTVTPLQVQAQ